MTRESEQSVRSRAGERCEYCTIPQVNSLIRFPIDHIIARQHGGQTVASNLAVCCARCNRFKGPNIAGIDPVSGVLTRLFNPRTDRWNEHFQWDGPRITGITPIGRTTVAVLNINDRANIAVRAQLIDEGWLMPKT